VPVFCHYGLRRVKVFQLSCDVNRPRSLYLCVYLAPDKGAVPFFGPPPVVNEVGNSAYYSQGERRRSETFAHNKRGLNFLLFLSPAVFP